MARQVEPAATPVACTLSSADLETQRRRWRRLAAKALVERAESKDGLRLSFRAEPGVAHELHELTAVERQCCAWASWTVHESGARLTLVVRSTGEGIAALHAMFTGLESAWVA